MGWRRLDSTQVARQLRAAFDRSETGTEKMAELAVAHMRSQLLGGQYVAVQDDDGGTFIGTPEEAVEHMMGEAPG
jgi:proline racemase